MVKRLMFTDNKEVKLLSGRTQKMWQMKIPFALEEEKQRKMTVGNKCHKIVICFSFNWK